MNPSDAHNQYLEKLLQSENAPSIPFDSRDRIKEVILLHFDQEFPQRSQSLFFKNLGISVFGTLTMAVFIFMVIRSKAPVVPQDRELTNIEMELEEFTIPEEDFSLSL